VMTVTELSEQRLARSNRETGIGRSTMLPTVLRTGGLMEFAAKRSSLV
jgi:hypothetical protein